MQVIRLRGLLGTMRGLRLPVSVLDGFIRPPPRLSIILSRVRVRSVGERSSDLANLFRF